MHYLLPLRNVRGFHVYCCCFVVSSVTTMALTNGSYSCRLSRMRIWRNWTSLPIIPIFWIFNLQKRLNNDYTILTAGRDQVQNSISLMVKKCQRFVCECYWIHTGTSMGEHTLFIPRIWAELPWGQHLWCVHITSIFLNLLVKWAPQC